VVAQRFTSYVGHARLAWQGGSPVLRCAIMLNVKLQRAQDRLAPIGVRPSDPLTESVKRK
jgi:hypothetical protein